MSSSVRRTRGANARASPGSTTRISSRAVAAPYGRRQQAARQAASTSGRTTWRSSTRSLATEQENLDLLLPLRATPKNEQFKQSRSGMAPWGAETRSCRKLVLVDEAAEELAPVQVRQRYGRVAS